VMGYIPGFVLAVGLYELTLNATSGTLPVAMELPRAIFVFILAVSMCTLSGLLSVQKVIATDPAEVF
ncbi:MAG: DevC protein, partial [Oscillatoriales cyanobacterium RM1_1_9]|nr:DevC protein [Oscillatoriales cyanobacterium RM1_1_9]